MALSDYLVPRFTDSSNICFDCGRACGDCPWSELNPDTGRPRFEPVPGWTAQKRMLCLGSSHGKKLWTETYRITECPMFTPDRPRRAIEEGA